MKKYRIKLIALFVAVALMLPSFTGAGALVENEVDDGLLTWEEVEEIVSLEEPATKANEKLLAAWADENDIVVLPSTFGGCYITDDYKLVVKLVQGDPLLRQEIEKIVGDSSVLRFVDTNISLYGLYQIQASLNKLLPGVEVAGSGISVESCKVNVRVAPNSPIPYTNNPYICIEPSTPLSLQTSVTYDPGNTISYSDKQGIKEDGTLGWYGTYKFDKETSECFVTAGHVIEGFESRNSDTYFDSTSVFPKDKYSDKSYCIYKAGGSAEHPTKGDYAILSCDATSTIINLTNNFQKDNLTMAVTESLGKSASSTGDLTLIEGKTVFKAKGYSSFRTAQVIELNCTDTLSSSGVISSRTISGMVKVESLWHNNPFSVPGDSGAPLYYKKSGSIPTLVGFITGGDGEKYSYFTPITILRDLGFDPYLG